MQTPTSILRAILSHPAYSSLSLAHGAILCDLDDSALFDVHGQVYGKKANKSKLAAMLQVAVDAGLLAAEPYQRRTPGNRFSPYKGGTRYRVTAAGLAA